MAHELTVAFFNMTEIAVNNLSASEAFNFMNPLLLFVLAMIGYSIFIFHFYKFIGRREIFTLDMEAEGNWRHSKKGYKMFIYFLKHLVFYPIVVLFSFFVLTVLFAFLSKSQTIDTIILIAMALVAAIRIVSYYSEEMSTNLAKMIPFALLGVFLVDISYFSIENSINSLMQLPNYWKPIVYYAVFVVFAEIFMRIAHMIVVRILRKKEEPMF